MATHAPSPVALAEEADEVLAQVHQRLTAIYDELAYATSLITNPEAAQPWADLRPHVLRLANAVAATKTALGRTPQGQKSYAIKEGKRAGGRSIT